MNVALILVRRFPCQRFAGRSVIIANTDHQPERALRSIRTLLSKRINGLISVAPALYTNELLVRQSTHT